MNFLKGIAVLLVVCLEIFWVTTEKLPSGISERLYCEGCSATVKELMKKINKRSGDSLEVRVIEALEDICTNPNFRTYDFSPPSTTKACKLLLERHEEEIEVLLQKKDVPDKEKAICYELSKACEGVDRSEKPKEPMDVRINDEKQEIQQGADGINRMNVDINDPNAAKRLADQIKNQLNLNQGGGGEEEDGDEEEEEETGERPATAEDGEDTGQRTLSLEELEKLAKEEEEAEKAEKAKASAGQEGKVKEADEKAEKENSNKNAKTEL